MSGKWIAAIAAGVALSLAARPTQAELITWQFGGVVTSLQDPAGVWTGRLHAGDAFSGTCTFESTIADTLPDDPMWGEYTSPPPDVSIDLGGLTLQAQGARRSITIANGPPALGDYWSVSSTRFDSNGLTIDEFNVGLSGGQAEVFASDELPTTPPVLSEFRDAALWIDGGKPDVGRFIIQASVTYLTVPEPSVLGAAMMMALVLHRPIAA
jgi:hypothetical protein